MLTDNLSLCKLENVVMVYLRDSCNGNSKFVSMSLVGFRMVNKNVWSTVRQEIIITVTIFKLFYNKTSIKRKRLIEKPLSSLNDWIIENMICLTIDNRYTWTILMNYCKHSCTIHTFSYATKLNHGILYHFIIHFDSPTFFLPCTFHIL